MKQTAKLALGGIAAALATLCLVLTVFPYATYALPAIAGVMLLPVALECGTGWAVGSYLAAGGLSLLLAPDWEAKFFFLFLLGYYPTLKLWLDGLAHPVVKWGLKLALFNLAAVGATLLLQALIGLPEDSFTLFGVSLPLVFLLLGNGVFVLYDWGLSRVILAYEIRLHPLLSRLWRS